MNETLGICPTGEHVADLRQCGFAGCVDLRAWAKAKRYKYRVEESYGAESAAHVRGDGRWFVEILCQNGLIYPCGGLHLLAYAKSGVVKRMIDLGLDIRQTDATARVFRFHVDRLDEVAAILKPRRKRTIVPSPRQLEALAAGRKRLDSERENGPTNNGRL